MRVVSVCIPYPRPEHRFEGIFVHRRLTALSLRVALTTVSLLAVVAVAVARAVAPARTASPRPDGA